MNHAMVVTRLQAEREKEEAELQRQQTERSGVRPREVEGLDGGDGRTKKEIRKFLGLTGYYRRFIPDYATIAAALSDLTRNDKPTQLEWNAGCEEAFQRLKNALCSQPILQMPDFRRGFIVQTDASDRGVGAVLSQMAEDGSDQPVGYFSRKLLTREEKYSTIEKECLANQTGCPGIPCLPSRTSFYNTDRPSGA